MVAGVVILSLSDRVNISAYFKFKALKCFLIVSKEHLILIKILSTPLPYFVIIIILLFCDFVNYVKYVNTLLYYYV
jgi:hypothetical protein